MVVDGSLKIAFRGDDGEPIGGGDQEIGVIEREVAQHVFEIITSVTADNDHFTDALRVERSYDVAQDGTLGFIAGVDAKRQLPLSRIL